MRKRCARKIRIPSIPMTQGLHDKIALEVELTWLALNSAPNKMQCDLLAELFAVVGLTLKDDARFVAQERIMSSAIRTLQQVIAAKECRPTAIELMSIENAVRACDEIFPRLDVTKLYLSVRAIRAMT